MIQLIHAFIRTIPGERSFNARLIELVARAVHAIAVQLFNLEEKLHTESEIESTTTARDEPFILRSIGGEVSVRQSPLKKTLFFHGAYQDDHQYPHGIADTAAFWAEDRIFGGVFLFDRRETGTEACTALTLFKEKFWFPFACCTSNTRWQPTLRSQMMYSCTQIAGNGRTVSGGSSAGRSMLSWAS